MYSNNQQNSAGQFYGNGQNFQSQFSAFPQQPYPQGIMNPEQQGLIERFFGTIQNFQNQMIAIQQQIAQQGINPQQQVQMLLNSGRMAQGQFNEFRAMANTILGTNL